MDNASYCKLLADFPKPFELRFKSGLSRLPLRLISGIGLSCIAVSKPRAVLLYGGSKFSAKKRQTKMGTRRFSIIDASWVCITKALPQNHWLHLLNLQKLLCTSSFSAQCFLSISLPLREIQLSNLTEAKGGQCWVAPWH